MIDTYELLDSETDVFSLLSETEILGLVRRMDIIGQLLRRQQEELITSLVPIEAEWIDKERTKLIGSETIA